MRSKGSFREIVMDCKIMLPVTFSEAIKTKRRISKMKKLLALVLTAALLLSCLSLACAEEAKTLTVVTWDATTTPYLIAH